MCVVMMVGMMMNNIIILTFISSSGPVGRVLIVDTLFERNEVE
jgi:hypothetical protein